MFIMRAVSSWCHRRIIPMHEHLQITLKERMAFTCPGGSGSCQLSQSLLFAALPCDMGWITLLSLWFLLPVSQQQLRASALPIFSGVNSHEDLPTSQKRAGLEQSTDQRWELEQVTWPLYPSVSLPKDGGLRIDLTQACVIRMLGPTPPASPGHFLRKPLCSLAVSASVFF